MGGAAAAMPGSTLLATGGTAGTDGSNVGFSDGSFGSMSTKAYRDRSGNTRTINFLIWTGSGIQFWCNAPSVPNSDATFEKIVLSGAGGLVRLSRGAASYNGAQSGGLYSSWTWTDSTQPASNGNAYTLNVS